MCAKASLFVFCVCFFLHASASIAAPPMPISHPQKIEVKKVKLNKFGPNGRATFGQIKSTTEDPIKKNNKPIKGGASTQDYYKSSSLHKALMQRTKSEDSRWAEVNVREMDSSIFSEEALSEKDYQPPHRKAPIHNK